MPKYPHLFVTSGTQLQHCSLGSTVGNTLRNLELPCPSPSKFAIGILANKDHLGHPSFAMTKPSKEGEEERSWCRVSPFPMKDRQGYAACWYKRVNAMLPPGLLSNVERFTS